METNNLQERSKIRLFTKGNIILLTGCLLVTLVTFFFVLMYGGITRLSFSEILHAVLHRSSGTSSNQLINELRLPHTINTLLYGAAIGVASVLLQRVTHFRAICPSTLGLVPTGIVIMFLSLYFFEIQNEWLAALIGILGAAFGLLASYMFSLVVPIKAKGMRYLVGGLLTTAIIGIIMFILLIKFNQESILISQLQRGMFRTGYQLIPFSLLCICFALYLSSRMNGGPSSDPVRLVMVCILLAIVLTGSAIATLGNWAMIGLIASNIARWLVRKEDYRVILPAAAMIGAVIVSLVNAIPLLLHLPFEIQFHTVINLIGLPLLVSLIWQEAVRYSKLAKPD